MQYLKDSQVRIFYQDKKENMVGGFCLNSGPNYRTFLPLNPNQLHQLKQDNNFAKESPNEISCLWIEEKSRKSKWVAFLFFMLLIDVLRLKSHVVIFGTHGKNINNYFKYPMPEVIFDKKLFVATKGELCDFWIRKGTKLHILKGYLVLALLRLGLGYKALAKFRFHSKEN